MRKAFLALAAICAAQPAFAQDAVVTSRAVFVETAAADNGWRSLAPATDLKRGDRVILLIEWDNARSRKQTSVRSAIPKQLAFQESSADRLEVSVNGGRSWGALGTLWIGERLASPEDVTHVRLRTSGARSGRLTYSAIVR